MLRTCRKIGLLGAKKIRFVAASDLIKYLLKGQITKAAPYVRNYF